MLAKARNESSLSRRLVFSDDGWSDYLYWQETDRRTLKKLNALIKECLRHPDTGTGQPEALRFDYAGWWSRRIDEENRLVYRSDEDSLEIASCRYHYRRN